MRRDLDSHRDRSVSESRSLSDSASCSRCRRRRYAQSAEQVVHVDASVFAPAWDNARLAVDDNPAAGDVNNPVGRDTGAGVVLRGGVSVVAEAGDGLRDHEADVGDGGIAIRVAVVAWVAADEGEVGKRGVGGIENNCALGSEPPTGGQLTDKGRRDDVPDRALPFALGHPLVPSPVLEGDTAILGEHAGFGHLGDECR
jgi:hypothetical protein